MEDRDEVQTARDAMTLVTRLASRKQAVLWFRRRDSNSMRRCNANPKRGAILARTVSWSHEIVDPSPVPLVPFRSVCASRVAAT